MKNIVSKFQNTDPEFAELIQNFACDEVVNNDDLDDHTRMIAVLSTLIGSQSVDAFKEMLGYALETGVTPVEVKEIVYQAVAYLGLGRVFPFLACTNDVLEKQGVQLPLERQTGWKKESRHRWTFLAIRCEDSPSPIRRRAGTSTSGSLTIASETIIPARALITDKER